jgi:hypothetical protein
MLCPYCGHLSGNRKECERCRGLFEPLSRQASQNAMGPWYIRDETNPFRPGCSYGTVKALIARKRIDLDTVLRGPSTRQFWLRARSTPGVAHLLGECHACHRTADPAGSSCPQCGASFVVEEDRQFLGLAEIRVIPPQTAPARPNPKEALRPTEPAQPAAQLIVADPPPAEFEPAPAPAPNAYEPIRHPSRPQYERRTVSDDQIDEMLRKGRTYERANSGTRAVTILIALAILGVLITLIFAAIMLMQNLNTSKAAAGTAAGTSTTGTTTPPPAAPGSSR